MSVETPSIFSKIIEDHLELKRRNARLDADLPLSRYMSDDPFENHPLFKTEEQARLEETMGGTEPVPASAMAVAGSEEAMRTWSEPSAQQVADEDQGGLWGRSRDFDWGD